MPLKYQKDIVESFAVVVSWTNEEVSSNFFYLRFCSNENKLYIFFRPILDNLHSETNFDITAAESCQTGRRTAEPPKCTISEMPVA